MFIITADQIPESEWIRTFKTLDEAIEYAKDNLNDNDGEHGYYVSGMEYSDFRDVLYGNGYFLEFTS